MVPVVIKLQHQWYLFLRVCPKGLTKSHIQLSAASAETATPPPPPPPLRQPFPCFKCFNVKLSIDKQTSASWHQDTWTKTVQFTTKCWSGKTQILFKLKACSNLRGMWNKFTIVFTMSILVLFDVMVTIKLYFTHIILYLVVTVLG